MKHFLLLVLCSWLLASSASAAFIYSGLQNIAIPTGTSDFSIDIDNAATAGTDFVGADINPFFGGSGLINNAAFQPVRTGTNFDDAIVRLNSGDLISSALNFSTGIGESGGANNHMGAGANQFFPGTEAFLGFKFTKNDNSGTFFGWIRLVFTSGAAGGLIKDWVYDDAGVPILAGAPEPGRVVLLMLGLLAIGARRRWRKSLLGRGSDFCGSSL